MDVRNGSPSCEEARQMDMVEYLSILGFQPKKIRNADYWYLSPLRTEKTASFKINRAINCWYDHGIGKGGNIIDFAILYHKCTVEEFLKSLKPNLSFHRSANLALNKVQENTNDKIRIIANKPVSSLVLTRYLHKRNIPFLIGDKFCREITFQLYGKQHAALAFLNDAGGYELRNEYFKGSSAPKDITTIDNGAKKAAVFEGFFDFLSFLVLFQKKEFSPLNFCILNSLSFFEKARLFMEQNKVIYLYLDNDAAGQNCSSHAMNLDIRYRDESGLYKSYKDLNEWIMTMGKLDRHAEGP